MIVDREGDLVLTDEDNLLRLDVGGFLMLATGEEIEQRMPQRQALRGRQLARIGFKMESIKLGPRWRMEPAVTATVNGRPVNLEVEQTTLPDGTIQLVAVTSPSPELTEPPQQDSCTGR